MRTFYLGWDPGVKGSVAVIYPNGDAYAIPFDAVKCNEFLRDLRNRALPEDDFICCIEKVNARPGQGIQAMFNFGMNFGYCKGLLTAYRVRYQEISPQRWKKSFSLIGKDKKASIEVCQKLWPEVNLLPTPKSRVPSDGMAEALLMATFCQRGFQ